MEQLRAGSSPSCPYARGITTIELLISIAISLLILSALTYIYLGSRGAYQTNEGAARVQEAGRFALDWLSRDLRMASHLGPGSRQPLDELKVIARPALLALDGASPFSGPDQMVTGYEDGAGWTTGVTNFTSKTRVAGDVLWIRGATGVAQEIATITDVDGSRICVFNKNFAPKKNEMAMVATFDRLIVFRVTNDPTIASSLCTQGGANGAWIEHKNGTAAEPGNGVVGDPETAKIRPAFEASTRAVVQRMQNVQYFISSNPAGRPSLYRWDGGAAEELVENVEDMDVAYGEDTNNDGAPDSYVAASAVTNWGRVVNVRVSLLVVSPEAGTTNAAQRLFFRDTNGDGLPDEQTAPDNRLRQVFTTTVALRNRLL